MQITFWLVSFAIMTLGQTSIDHKSSTPFEIRMEDLHKSTLDITENSSSFITTTDTSIEEILKTTPTEVPSKKQISWSYSNEYHWIHYKMTTTEEVRAPLILAFDNYLTGMMDFYLVQNQTALARKVGGSGTPSVEREVTGLINGFKFTPPVGSFDIYLKIKTRHNFSNRILLGTAEKIKDLENLRKSIILIFVGALLFLIFYNLAIAVYLSDRSFYWYVFFNVIMLFITSIFNGMIDYLPTISSWTYSEHLMVFSCLAAIVNFQFMRVYLDLDFVNPKLVKLLQYIQLIAGLILIVHISPVERMTLGAKLGFGVDLVISIEIILMLAIPIYYSLQKNKMALFYLYGWIFLSASVLVFELALYNIIENTELVRSSLLYGTGLQMLMLSLGLAYRFKVLNSNLISAEKKALSRDKYKRLTRILLHDLGNPLTIISAVGRNLGSSQEKMTAEHGAHRIQRAISNISSILDHVRKGVLSDEDSTSNEVQPVALEPLLNESLFIFEEILKGKSIELLVDVEPDIRVLAEPSSLLNDVINNVISNAIKFSQPGSQITISDNHDSSWYILKIRDSGIGIPAPLLEMIQKDGTVDSRQGTSGESGTGFGVSLVRSYMKIYGGKVKIFSTEAGPSGQTSYTEVQLYFKTN